MTRALPRTRLLGLLVAAAASLAPVVARANSASTATPPIAVRDVRAGETVELAWAALPADAREVEVLLSVDGGARFSLRASASVDAARGRVRWRVPALPTEHARLRVRWGDGRSETLGAPTAEFRIVADGAALASPPAWDEDDPRSAGPVSGGAADWCSPGATLAAGADEMPGTPAPGSPAAPLAGARRARLVPSAGPAAPARTPRAVVPARRSPLRE